MARSTLRFLLAAGPLLAAVGLLANAQTSQPNKSSQPAGMPELADYRTADKAITAQFSAASAEITAKTGYLGVSVMDDAKGRVIVEEVQPDSPADKAGIKKGDVVTQVGAHTISSPLAFREWLQTYSAGSPVKLSLTRQDKKIDVTATLAATSRPMAKGDQGGGDKGGGKGGKGGGKGGAGGPLALWKKPLFRVGVVRIEFSDVKHNDKVTTKDWEEAILSKGTYAKKKEDATGQKVYGSLNDYFIEQSAGAFHFEGKVFDWVNVGKKRADYIQGTGTSNKTAVLSDAISKISSRDGNNAFKDLDGLLFIYAGDRYKTNAGAVYYPHASAITAQGQRLPYFLAPEGGQRMTTINGFVKVAGEALGLPDLAARTDTAGSRGLGQWCAMSNTLDTGRPQHFGAWAKERLGWIKPAVIDPTQKQKLLLSPIEDSPKECYKVLVRPNGSEYYLLENRRKKGFDADLPAEGLLIWRVINDRPVLVESHGIDSPKGPLTQLSAVPFPSDINKAFTPDTTPSSRSPLGGGLPVHITQIQRVPDGRIAFIIGYEYR